MTREVRDNPRYLVTDDGKVINKKTGRALKPQLGRKGYLRAYLWYGQQDKPKYIHRLVAEAFINNSDGYEEVNHKNFDKADNRVENLEWCSRQQNVRHAVDAGRVPKTRERQPGSYPKYSWAKSGYKGVYLERNRKGDNKWRAMLRRGGKRISLGYHPTPEKAHNAVMAYLSG